MTHPLDRRSLRTLIALTLCAAGLLLWAFAARAGAVEADLPQGAFASLRFGEVNARQGPSFEHKVLWRYQRAGMPVEVLARTEGWTKIRDPHGAEAWVHNRMLSDRASAYVAPGEGGAVVLRRRPDLNAQPVARLEAGVVAELTACTRDGWCSVRAEGAAGWAQERDLWTGL